MRGEGREEKGGEGRGDGRRGEGRRMEGRVGLSGNVAEEAFCLKSAPGLPDVVRNSALSEDAFAKLLKMYLMNCM